MRKVINDDVKRALPGSGKQWGQKSLFSSELLLISPHKVSPNIKRGYKNSSHIHV